MSFQKDPLALPVIKEEFDDDLITPIEGWSPLFENSATNSSVPLSSTTSQSVSNLSSPTATTSNDSTACSTGPLPNLVKAHKSAPSVHNRQKFDFQRHQIMLESTNIFYHPSIHPGPSIRNKIPLVTSGKKVQNNTSTPMFNIHLKLKQTQKQLKELTNNLIECQTENEMLKKDNKKLQLKYFEFETNANFKLDTLHKENSMLKDEINQLKGHQLRNEPSIVVDFLTSANQSNEANMNDVMISENELLNENKNNSDHVLDGAEEMSNTTTDNDDHSVVESFDTSASARLESIQNASDLQTGSILHNLRKRKQSQPNRPVKRSKNIIENQQHCESIDRLLAPSNEQEQAIPRIHSSSQSGGNSIAPVSLESSSSTVQSINEIEQAKIEKCAKKYECSDCGNVYTSRSSLNTHRGRIHNGEQSRKCTECGKMFTRNFNLRLHMLVHSDARPFKCNWENCQKAFNDNSNLTRHLRIHLGERPFKCEWENCQMAFNDNSNLARHLRIHTGERPFKCEWENCQMAFNVSSHLVIHLRKHTGERPFKCDQANCTKAFSQSSGLTRHLLTHK